MATQSKSKKLKGNRQKVKLFRSSEPLKSVFMWGINYSLHTLQHVRPHPVLVRNDYRSCIKIKVSNRLFNKENMPTKYKYKEYCPLVFQNLRRKFDVDNDDYLDSFTQCEPQWEGTGGRGHQKYLLTFNRHYVIKTLHSEDVIQLHQMLENYHDYVVGNNGETLLPQFLGLYRITVNDTETYLLAMRNVFSPRLPLHRMYDLKGLPADRAAGDKERNRPIPLLKDDDFLQTQSVIEVGADARAQLMAKLDRDIKFLQENNMTNYSLLVGVHDADEPNEYPPRKWLLPATNTPESNDNAGSLETAFDDEVSGKAQAFASPGDGFGAVIDAIRKRSSLAPQVPTSIGFPGVPTTTSGNTGVHSRSQTDEDDEVLSDGAGAREPSELQDVPRRVPGQSMMMTPPESPPDDKAVFSIPSFEGTLLPQFEKYAIPSAPNATRRRVFFVALVGVLSHYGMRKRTAKPYKTAKHGVNASCEQYGRRLLDFAHAHFS